jgi:glycosyltransferase involved in cell wall biosynthesis
LPIQEAMRIDQTSPRIVLEAPLAVVSSASILTRATAAALRAGGAEVTLVDRDRVAPAAGAAPPHLWLSAGWPPRTQRPPAGTWAIRFDYEYGALPQACAGQILHGADRVVVHSRAVQQVVLAAGSDPGRVVCVPHGVDGMVFSPQTAPSPEILAWKGTRRALLFVGGLIWRKGIDVLLRALAAPGRRDLDLCLVVKPIGGETHYRGYHLAELVQRCAANRHFPEILVVDRELDTPAMAGLYRACDLLVHPYRGEGFGLPILEARACGLPVVVTGGGSADDFCTGRSCLRVVAARRPVELPQPHCGQPWVLEPDPGSLRATLATALADLPALTRLAQEESEDVRAHWTWGRSANALMRLVAADPLPGPASGDVLATTVNGPGCGLKA